MQVSVGYGDHPESIIAGKQAARMALAKVDRKEPCDLVFLFCTARHNQQVLRNAVVSVVGNSKCIFGGGAAGVITNEYYGYAGDQVGIACIWLDDSSCTALSETGLAESESETGVRLGKQMLNAGITQESPVMLFYDAINRNGKDMRLLMATWILKGIENGMGFLPRLMGAGLQGDHACSATMQYTGEKLEEHAVMSLAFSEDICIDNIIMHGCRPASPYYTVTKAEGSVILEINGKPAISFIDEVIDSAIAPEEYPFFLLFGLNHGDPWGEYDESNYASRLCLGIDKERGGIVMFEPDMVEGMQFQIMFRSLDLDYMKPKIQKLFAQLEDREPIFAMYIDCAGRCAGYGGVDVEDARVVQNAVGKDIPLLGIYTGAEIAPMRGHSRGLDLTGVFCLFSKRKDRKILHQQVSNDMVKEQLAGDYACEKMNPPLDGVIQLCEKNAAKVLALDNMSINIRHELEQKRRGFALLAEISVSLCEGDGGSDVFFPVTQRINSALNMQKTVILFPDSDGQFVPHVIQGYSIEEKDLLMGQPIEVDAELLDPEQQVLITAADSDERLRTLRETLRLPYFISAPVVVKGEVAAIIITGRMVESPPFLCRLGRSEVETVQAISALLASVLVYRKLDDATRRAQSDVLTGLLNRGALELKVAQCLQNVGMAPKRYAFIIIDCDYFKEINDSYGHMMGDQVLNALARFLQKSFRADECVARIGGDEFAVFCEMTDHGQSMMDRAAYLVEEWGKYVHKVKDGTSFSATVSIGISFTPRDGSAYDELFHCADMALYRSKQNGRNQYTVYNAETMDAYKQ